MRLTNWHCSDEECADRFFQAQKKCCMIAFVIFCLLFVMIAMFTSPDEIDTVDTSTAIAAVSQLVE